jgi:hypothetical protein
MGEKGRGRIVSWQKIIGNIAPVLASAVAPPFGALAAAAVKEALNLSEGAGDKEIERAVIAASPADIQKLKEIDMNFSLRLEELQVSREQISATDRASARDREAKTGDKTTKILAFIIVISGLAMVAFTLAGFSRVESALAGALIGYIISEMKQVTGYYFGSSSGSALKTNLMQNK